jgi:hypothetical protein
MLSVVLKHVRGPLTVGAVDRLVACIVEALPLA